jgi:hypothetical protein
MEANPVRASISAAATIFSCLPITLQAGWTS